jgi:hypothetical protein
MAGATRWAAAEEQPIAEQFSLVQSQDRTRNKAQDDETAKPERVTPDAGARCLLSKQMFSKNIGSHSIRLLPDATVLFRKLDFGTNP